MRQHSGTILCAAMSPELETLDQLLSGELPLSVVCKLYPDVDTFLSGVHGLLKSGEVRLLTAQGDEVPDWRWRGLFVEGTITEQLKNFRLEITDQGSKRIG